MPAAGAVPGATVTVASPDKGVEQAGQSNAQGAFVFPLLPPGTYTVSVELSGFKKIAKSNVILPVASRVNVGDLVLEVGNVSEAVTVEANVGRLQIQTESGERSDLVTNAQLRDSRSTAATSSI
jgi:Cna protein B-type domain.